MSSSPTKTNELTRPGLRKEFRRINREIWLWAVERKLTKRQIKEHALCAFENAGISSFKASDGWYRRWRCQWVESAKALPNAAEQEKTSNIPLNINLSETALEETGAVDPSTSASEVSSTDDSPNSSDKLSEIKSELSNEENELKVQTTIECSGLSEATTSRPVKRKNERYLPQFKSKVVSFALKYSIKAATSHFKVNKSSIADWIRDQQKRPESCKGTVQFESRPDTDFVEWLQRERKCERLITKDLLLSKFKELISYNDREFVAKKGLWFYKYAERLTDANARTKTHIMYPTSFKRELAKMSEKSSKKTVGRLFNVDRKRISSWVERYLKSNYTKIERNVNCYLTDDKIDSYLWEWYKKQIAKPNSKQIRDRAVALYRQGGYKDINCSFGWYYRWRKRYTLPSSTIEKKEFDDQLICWVLGEFDENKSVSHAQLIAHATAIKGDSFKLSPSWIVRFLKRYSFLAQMLPSSSVKLPPSLEDKISKFHGSLLQLIEDNAIDMDNIVAFDEIPLNFSTSGDLQPKYLLRKSGFENCHASLIVACSARGILYPSTLILKARDEDIEETPNCITIALQSQGIADSPLIGDWFGKLLESFQSSCVFICDSYAPHKDLLNIYGDNLHERRSQLMIIPEGCSSRLLPILNGIGDELKKAVFFHWEKWLQESCWNAGNGVKLPPSRNIENWVAQAHMKCSEQFMGVIGEGFAKILRRV